MIRIVRTGLVLGGVTVALIAGGGTASAGEIDVYGQDECSQLARQYKDAGYKNVRCSHIHGNKYTLYYSEPRGNKPSTGSFGSG